MDNKYDLLFNIPGEWRATADWVLAGSVGTSYIWALQLETLNVWLTTIGLVLGIIIAGTRTYRLLTGQK